MKLSVKISSADTCTYCPYTRIFGGLWKYFCQIWCAHRYCHTAVRVRPKSHFSWNSRLRRFWQNLARRYRMKLWILNKIHVKMNVIAKISYFERSVVTLKLRKVYLNTVTYNTPVLLRIKYWTIWYIERQRQHIREFRTFKKQSGFFGPPCIYNFYTIGFECDIIIIIVLWYLKC